jgi:gamma-glutamylcyclotransferase (GGCT)/AIG2-like uncharacterized protein YtfP
MKEQPRAVYGGDKPRRLLEEEAALFMSLLFVYGTLRPGCPHPMAQFLAERAEHLGRARAAGRLYHLGRYPGMMEARTDEDWVKGDLYRMPDDQDQSLLELDRYENAESPLPAFFERQVAAVVAEDGTRQEAWIYWFRGNVNEEQRIANGDWLAAA